MEQENTVPLNMNWNEVAIFLLISQIIAELPEEIDFYGAAGRGLYQLGEQYGLAPEGRENALAILRQSGDAIRRIHAQRRQQTPPQE